MARGMSGIADDLDSGLRIIVTIIVAVILLYILYLVIMALGKIPT